MSVNQKVIDKDFRKNVILQGSLLVGCSAILYGFLGYFGINILRENISVSNMLFWRFLIAGVWMSLFAIRKHKKTNIFSQLDQRTLFFMFILGAVGYAGSSELYFSAIRYIGTGLAMVIFFSYPIMIALLTWLVHRQRFSLLTSITLVTMSVGLYLLRDAATHPLSLLGIMMALIGAVLYALYVFGSKRFSSVDMDSNLLTIMVCLSCALMFLIASTLTHQFAVPPSLRAWLFLVALGILGTALPIQFMLEGLKYVSSLRASIISVLEPLVTVIVGVMVLGESISHIQLIGAGIVLSSVRMVNLKKEL